MVVAAGDDDNIILSSSLTDALVLSVLRTQNHNCNHIPV